MITKIGASKAARRRRNLSTTMVVLTAALVATATGYLASAPRPNQTVANLPLGWAYEQQRDVRLAETSTAQIRSGQSSGSMPAPSSDATVGNVIDMTY